jgi:hypothetical protein
LKLITQAFYPTEALFTMNAVVLPGGVEDTKVGQIKIFGEKYCRMEHLSE